MKQKFVQRIQKSMFLMLMATGVSHAESVRSPLTITSALGDEIPAYMSRPVELAEGRLYPACLVIHGSGGLFKENDPGQTCSEELENNYDDIFAVLESLDVVAVAPDSFGRSPLFCEDNNEAFMPFAPAPFFNAGDGNPVRDDAYKSRRIETRVLDAFGALSYLKNLSYVDPENICVIGTSNGGTVAMAMSANGIIKHLIEYTNTQQQRPFESNDDFLERQNIFSNYPSLPQDLNNQLLTLPVMNFSHAISPGCYMRKLIPTVHPDDISIVDYPDDVYYPNDGHSGFSATVQYVDMGSLDSVPDHCRPDGIRYQQAQAYENTFQLSPSRWKIQEYEGFDHDLVGDNPAVLEKFNDLVIDHFYVIFKNNFD